MGFIEQKCVQCGLCERGCPERAIRLRPRFLPDAPSRNRPRLMASDPLVTCIECRKPFMSRRMLEASIAKVGHLPQFAADGARRLRMCPACRQRGTLLDARRDWAEFVDLRGIGRPEQHANCSGEGTADGNEAVYRLFRFFLAP